MDSEEKSPSTMQRVKLYHLKEDGRWDELGTGHITVDYMDRSSSEDMALFVNEEEDNEILLLHRISADNIYRKEEETIIAWKDPEFTIDMALSFQETIGCNYIWDQLCSLRRTIQVRTLANETVHNINNDSRKLPPVELATLPLILKIVESGIADHVRVTELMLHDEVFFRKLMEQFRICDDLKNVDGLHLIFKIVRGIILLNSPKIFEKIFGDEFIMDIMGCLEFESEAPKADHRKFLEEHVVFKEAIPIKDPIVRSKIYQAYIIGYLKDIIFPTALDASIVANLNSIIHSNNATVVSLLKDDSTFIKELFARLKSPTTSVESKKNLVRFLHEFCTLSKSLQIVQQHRLFRDLVNEGLFDIIAYILQSEDKKLVLTGTDILDLLQRLDSTNLRSYIARTDGSLFRLLGKNMLTDFGDDMQGQFVEIICNLLDASPTPGPGPGSQDEKTQREHIVKIFYEKHFGQLIDTITSSCQPNCLGKIDNKSVSLDGGSRSQSGAKPEILLHICDLLRFCVLQHPYRIKSNFLHNNVIDKVLYLTRRREKYLQVAAIRFMKAVVSRSDEHLMNHLVENNLLKPVIDAFVANGLRNNLLNSVVLDLIEYILKENLKVLVRYLVDTFWDQLVKFESLPSINALKLKHEQSLENLDTTITDSLLDQRKQLDDRALEKEDSASALSTRHKHSQHPASDNVYPPSPRPGRLVDYDDDEDDEDWKPPPKMTKDVSDEDMGLTDFRLKRELASKEEPGPKRLQLSPKGLKSGGGIFASLSSTLSEVVLETTTLNITPNENSDAVDPTDKVDVPRSFTGKTDDSEDNSKRGE